MGRRTVTERSVRNVLISGASIAGPALAFWLARYGIAVTIVEKASSLRGGYPIVVRGTAIEAVERMGLYAQMRAAHVDTQSIGFVDVNGAVVAKIDPEAITGGVRGKDIEIRRGDIATTLYAATKDTANYRFNDSIAALEEHADGVNVTFVSGDSRTQPGDLVVLPQERRQLQRLQMVGEQDLRCVGHAATPANRSMYDRADVVATVALGKYG
jgi:2-polyprenyl-6-methoxyphenol hydroxylase-like FAD-dependent oxidoreductase